MVYTDLSIDQKINLKAAILAKGIIWGTLPIGWQAMNIPLVKHDLSLDNDLIDKASGVSETTLLALRLPNYFKTMFRFQ